jgi:succinate dehydrogenase/fumarate reductase-like Fe-S protein
MRGAMLWIRVEYIYLSVDGLVPLSRALRLIKAFGGIYQYQYQCEEGLCGSIGHTTSLTPYLECCFDFITLIF